MKKQLTFLFILTAFTSSAQVYQNDPSYGRSIDRYEVRKDLGIPTFCGEPTVNSTVTNKAKIAYDSCGGIFYIFNPKTLSWTTISGSTLPLQDGRISGAEVTWTGDSTAFFIQAGTFRKFGEFYTTNDTTIILDRPNDLYGRIDLIVFDTTNGGEIRKVTGELSPTPVEPQVEDYQIKLTTGIAFSAGATTPSNVSVSLIYDENTEWTAGHTGTMTVNFDNTSMVYHGSKSAYVSSYSKNSALTFTGTSQTVTDAVLSFWINLSAAYSKSFTLQFWNGSTAASNPLTITNSFGLNPSKTGYQNVAIPLKSSFSWTSQTFDKLTIMMTGGGNFSGLPAFNLDYITLQNGGTTIPPSTDNSNKVDSTSTRKINDSTYVNLYWVKGLSYQKGDTVKIPKTDTSVIKVHYPLVSYNGDSLTVKVDSLPKLEYALPDRDTSLWDNQTLIDKQFLQDRISTATATGITRTELQDTAAAIRADFPTGGVWGSITGTLSDQTDLQSALDAKLNISDTASTLAHYLNQVGYGLTKSGQIVILDTSKYVTATRSGLLQNTDWTKFTNKTDSVSSNSGGDSLIVIKNNVRYAYKYPSSGGTGTVTSAGLTMDGTVFNSTVTGSPITTSGTFTPSLKSQSAWSLFGNNTSGTTAPTFFTNPYIDSIKLSTDSVFGKKNGSWLFQFKGSALSQWTTSGTAIYYNAGNVQVGAATTLYSYGGISSSNACTFGNVTGAAFFGSYYNANAAGFNGFTTTYTGFKHAPNINVSSGTGTVAGFQFLPTLTNLTGVTDVIGFENTYGNNYFNTLGYGTAIGTSSIPSNTIFKVASTTQTSHPFPNMTAAQKTAIPSPNVGDHIYQTDGTEGVYVYKSTGWVFAY